MSSTRKFFFPGNQIKEVEHLEKLCIRESQQPRHRILVKYTLFCKYKPNQSRFLALKIIIIQFFKQFRPERKHLMQQLLTDITTIRQENT